MEELNINEIDAVAGAGIVGDIMYGIGYGAGYAGGYLGHVLTYMALVDLAYDFGRGTWQRVLRWCKRARNSIVFIEQALVCFFSFIYAWTKTNNHG